MWWHEPTVHTPDGEGFWSVATYDEVLQVLRDPVTFSSETGGDRPYGGTIIQDLPVAGVVLNMMDDPRHARIRRLVSKGLTPAAVRGAGGRAPTAHATPARDGGRGVRLPGGNRGGTPDAGHLSSARNARVRPAPAFPGRRTHLRHSRRVRFPRHDSATAGGARRDVALRHRADCGAADAARATTCSPPWSHARLPDADPPRLTDDELSAFFSLLFSAGAETTRNAIAGGLLALIENPDQLALLREGRVPMHSARSRRSCAGRRPPPSKRRTATTDCRFGGCAIATGQKVVVWEGSANRDPRQFARSDAFLLARDPNPHLAFGHGVHFCLGAHLSRLEIRIALEEVLASAESFALAGSPEWTRSNRHTGIRHLPLSLRRPNRRPA